MSAQSEELTGSGFHQESRGRWGPPACQPPLCTVKTAQPVRLQSLAPVQAGAQMRGPPSLASAPIVVVDVHASVLGAARTRDSPRCADSLCGLRLAEPRALAVWPRCADSLCGLGLAAPCGLIVWARTRRTVCVWPERERCHCSPVLGGCVRGSVCEQSAPNKNRRLSRR